MGSTPQHRENEGFFRNINENTNANTNSNIHTNTIVIPDIDPYFLKITKSVCKIEYNENYFSGFLLKIPKDQDNENYFFCLMANESNITEDMVENNETIEIKYDNDFSSMKIRLNEKERIIRNFKDIKLDIIVIEILYEDDICEDFFLSMELSKENLNEKKLKYAQIFLPKVDREERHKKLKNTIDSIHNNEFILSNRTEEENSGSPIFLKHSINVIGITKGNMNANFIYPVADLIKKELRTSKKQPSIKTIKKEYDNGDYYIGDLKDDIPNGKGILYYKGGKIKYEGEFIDGDYNGKGKEYYHDGKVKYEGNFAHNQYNGSGTYTWVNGEYYSGEFKNGAMHGKGKEYYVNGNIKYDGEFKNGLYDGEGKYVFKNGISYVGQYKEGKRNGKGIKFDKDGNVILEGEYLNGTFVGS